MGFFNGDLDLNFLAVGETITLTYDITVDDGNGLPATQSPLTVTITGTNDQPVITAQIPDFDVIEAAGNGLTTVNQTGSLGFSDLDINDTLTVAESFTGATWSGGQLTVEQSNALDLFTINPGNGDWAFNGDLDLNFLAVGETITLTYDITVDDGNGLPATQSPLTVTITGTNDQPVITAQIPDFDVIEAAGNGLTTVNQTGSLGFSDLDINDTLTVAESFTGATWSGGQLTPEQSNALDLFTINPGNGDWAFNGDLDLNFLAVGETITLTYDITVDDGNGTTRHSKPSHRHHHRHQ